MKYQGPITNTMTSETGAQAAGVENVLNWAPIDLVLPLKVFYQFI